MSYRASAWNVLMVLLLNTITYFISIAEQFHFQLVLIQGELINLSNGDDRLMLLLTH